jgi:hypothetical protein
MQEVGLCMHDRYVDIMLDVLLLIPNIYRVGEESTLAVRDSPSAFRARSSKDNFRVSLCKREIASYATATAEGGMPASWATLIP